MTNLIEAARAFAIHVHGAQQRRYTGDPYWHHLRNVAATVAGVPDATPEMIAAGWLHDTVDDTDVTIEKIEAEFGKVVAQMVWYLTDVPLIAGNRARRKALDRDRLARADWAVQTIKCADIIDNTWTIAEHDPDFARVYLPEVSMCIDELSKVDPTLRANAYCSTGKAAGVAYGKVVVVDVGQTVWADDTPFPQAKPMSPVGGNISGCGPDASRVAERIEYVGDTIAVVGTPGGRG